MHPSRSEVDNLNFWANINYIQNLLSQVEWIVSIQFLTRWFLNYGWLLHLVIDLLAILKKNLN